MKADILSISRVIPESNIVMFSPHFDDFLFNLGGYVLEMRKQSLLHTKKFHVLLQFPRSNYLAGTGQGNYDTGLDRVKLATGKRLLEDMNCLDELLGEFNYRYELKGEVECFARAKAFADSEMEFPHGMYEDFDEKDGKIFERMKDCVREWAKMEDTALVFPLAIMEHIDHFIVREAGITVARELGDRTKARFYFQEDKPYGGIATEAELARSERFVLENSLKSVVYRNHPDEVIELAFRHYVSQVEEIYRKGIRGRSDYLKDLYGLGHACDRIFVYNPIK